MTSLTGIFCCWIRPLDWVGVWRAQKAAQLSSLTCLLRGTFLCTNEFFCVPSDQSHHLDWSLLNSTKFLLNLNQRQIILSSMMKTRMQQFAPNHHYGAIIDKNKSLSSTVVMTLALPPHRKKDFDSTLPLTQWQLVQVPTSHYPALDKHLTGHIGGWKLSWYVSLWDSTTLSGKKGVCPGQDWQSSTVLTQKGRQPVAIFIPSLQSPVKGLSPLKNPK